LNQLVAAEDAWIAPHEWDALAATDELVDDGEEVTLGCDPSKTDDHTTLMGCRVSDGYVFTLGVWDPVDHGGEAPREEIDAAVHAAFARYSVVGFFSDLHPFESYVDAWLKEFGQSLKVKASPRHAIAWDMRGRQKETTIEIERLYDEIVTAAFRHDGNPVVRQHFHNARRRPNNWGVSVAKEHRESARKIDAVPAVMLARTARRMLGPRRKYTGRAVF
jgi:phage terminase large subunit-like protein